MPCGGKSCSGFYASARSRTTGLPRLSSDKVSVSRTTGSCCRRDKPRLFVLCDVSDSVRSVARLLPLLRGIAPAFDTAAVSGELTNRALEELDYCHEGRHQPAQGTVFGTPCGSWSTFLHLSSPQKPLSTV